MKAKCTHPKKKTVFSYQCSESSFIEQECVSCGMYRLVVTKPYRSEGKWRRGMVGDGNKI